MEKQLLLVTNNQRAVLLYGNHAEIALEIPSPPSYEAVLLRSRDLIHLGWQLLSHPQASNLKPNQCPYKTILLGRGQAREAAAAARDVELIEAACSAYDKFTRGRSAPSWSRQALADFETVDLAVLETAINSSLLQHMLHNTSPQ